MVPSATPSATPCCFAERETVLFITFAYQSKFSQPMGFHFTVPCTPPMMLFDQRQQSIPADAKVKSVEVPPAFHDLRLQMEDAATTAPAPATCMPDAEAPKKRDTRPPAVTRAP